MRYDFDEPIDLSSTNSFKWGYVGKFMGNEDAIPMWVADMDFRGPQPVIDAVKKRAEIGVYGYSARPDSLNEAVVDWMQRRHHWHVEKDWICFSTGVIHALSAAVQSFTSVGDKIIIQPPVYPAFFKVVEANNRQLAMNPLIFENGRYRIDFDDLRQKASSSGAKMLILCTPHNPIGRVWTKAELDQLANICQEFDLLVVSDEIHSDLVFPDYKHTPFASLSESIANRTIVCVAPSKTFNLTGLQSSFIIIPNDELRKAFQDTIMGDFGFLGNVFTITAAESAYRYGDEWLEQCLDYIHGNLQYTLGYIATYLPELTVVEPEGTYLLWIDCRSFNLDPQSLHQFMLKEAGVALFNGDGFGVEGGGFIRLNLACRRATLVEALQRIEAAVRLKLNPQ